MGISLPYWASSYKGGLYGISLSLFLLMCFFGALILALGFSEGRSKLTQFLETLNPHPIVSFAMLFIKPRKHVNTIQFIMVLRGV